MTLAEIEAARELQKSGCGIVIRQSVPVDKPIPMPKHCKRKDIWEAIVAVSKDHSVPVEEIMGRSRVIRVVQARCAAIMAVADVVEWKPNAGNWSGQIWSTPRIGKLFGRHYSTVLHAMGRTARSRSRRLKRGNNA